MEFSRLNTGVGSISLLQGIFPTQGSNPGLTHCRRMLYQLSHKESPRIPEWIAYSFSSGSSRPRNQTRVSCIADGFFTSWALREAQWRIEFNYVAEEICMYDEWGIIHCNPMDCSPPGSSIHGISQASIVEWIAISYSIISLSLCSSVSLCLTCTQLDSIILKANELRCRNEYSESCIWYSRPQGYWCCLHYCFEFFANHLA